MTGLQDGVLDQPRDLSVNALLLLAEVPVENRREQRVREADRPILAFDDVRGDRRLERVSRNAGTLEERL